MERREYKQLLEKKQLPPVLLFEGEEEYLKQDALRALRAAFLPEGLEELNEAILDAPETDALIAAAETLPLMADRRLVIVRDHPALTGRAEADDRLIEYLPSVPSSCILLFYCTRKPDGRKKLYSAVRKLGGVVTFAPMKDLELTTFVTNAFRDQGRECDQRTADFLIFTVGTDTSRLLAEISKIASYHPEEPSVSPEDVRLLATPSTECTVFDMVDAVVSGQDARAFQLLRKVLLSGEDRVFVLAMLLRQFRLLQHIKIMQYEKLSPAAIRGALGIPPFAADRCIRQAALFTGGQAKRAVKLCFDTEYAIKSGRLNQEGAVEAVMLRLLCLRKKI